MDRNASLMDKLKKIIIVILLMSVILNLGIIYYITRPSIYSVPCSECLTTLVVGYGSNPAALDPVDTWDKPSQEMQRQVTEALISYDLSEPFNYKLKPNLVEYWVWESPTRISFKLREYVYFHDGTRLTAEDVKWNFERVMWFCNGTGTLPANTSSWEAFPSSLFFLANGTFIFKSFEASDVIDPYNFTILLNAPFAPLLDLLTVGITNILSPDSTPRWRYLDLAKDKLIGTGPYKYIHFVRDREIRFERWDMYWGFPGFFKNAIMRIIEDDTALMTAGLAGQLDYISTVPKIYLNSFVEDSHFHVENVGENLCYFYVELYCGPRDTAGNLIVPSNYQYQRNNATLRRALALALNYTYLYEVLQSENVVQGIPCVPRAMPGYNNSVILPSDYNFSTGVKMARELMKTINPICAPWDSSYPGADEELWTGTNLIGRELYFYERSNAYTLLNEVNQMLEDNWKLIGVKRDDNWGPYHCDYLIDYCEPFPWEIDVRYIGWCPDYLNPYSVIDPLFNVHSPSCFSQLNDTSTGGLTYMMNVALNERDRPKQLEIYGNIQSYIHDVSRPLTPASHAHIPLWAYPEYQIHKPYLKGIHYNPMLILEFSNWYY
ncbi:MAG: ABC transporter substrate-binding protein [Candidatus Heimdallarchaeota archaeon]